MVYLIALFVTCMICQGELARSRPSPRYLTTFYLTIAAGGALGGVFVALIAPRLFTEFSEYPIGLAAACLLGFVGWMRTRRHRSMDQPQFRRAAAADGVVDRRIHGACRHGHRPANKARWPAPVISTASCA